MKMIVLLSLLFAVVQCTNANKKYDDGSRDPAETTVPAFMGDYDEIDFEGQADLTMVCRIPVTGGNYHIRSEPRRRNGNICGSQVVTSRGNNGNPNMVIVLGNQGDWIKISSPETRTCEGGFAYVHKKAFYQGNRPSAGFEMYTNGECGRAAYDPGRTPIPEPPVVHPTQRVRNLNGYTYRFPLPRCLGLKHRGGRGEYGASRHHGRHGGCDYYSPNQTPIYAPCTGRITASGRFGNAGYMVKLRCNNGAEFKFMHMHPNRPPRARQGTRVSAGAVIGGVSNSGNASRQAPHLHLEYRHPGGRRDDPQKIWDCGGDSGH